ncbi:hypothetical protein AB0H88_13860 [Nonomuraea sp. NPDC050680]|uniref:hypothetical protein n=1 Tax=Nonomuraea sp. NPDC050680 TaxID=3154630 RepID=UPI0033C8D115
MVAEEVPGTFLPAAEIVSRPAAAPGEFASPTGRFAATPDRLVTAAGRFAATPGGLVVDPAAQAVSDTVTAAAATASAGFEGEDFEGEDFEGEGFEGEGFEGEDNGGSFDFTFDFDLDFDSAPGGTRASHSTDLVLHIPPGEPPS